ncbi:MAG: sulfite exporter TauE/SafE family protein [Gammaproteobacteria bacterium]|nr:sulfite exporter TauE/SafE family protein [Gammaproteobacteria bacterium]
MELYVAIAIVAIGSYIQSAIGFGLAIIAAPVLFFINPYYVPAPITVCALVLSLANTWTHRKSISFAGLKYAIIGRIPGSVAGALLILWIDQQLLGLWLGVMVLLAVVLSLKTVVFAPTTGHLVTAGFLSGFMGTSSSIGGPPMALVMQHQDAHYIRANLSAFFVLSTLMSLAMLAPVGFFGTQHMLLSLPLLPGTLLGYWLARKTWHLISPDLLRLSSLLLCSFCGLFAVLSYWL